MQVGGDDMENVEEICPTQVSRCSFIEKKKKSFKMLNARKKFHLSLCDESDNEELGTSPSFSYTNNIITKNKKKGGRYF